MLTYGQNHLVSAAYMSPTELLSTLKAEHMLNLVILSYTAILGSTMVADTHCPEDKPSTLQGH